MSKEQTTEEAKTDTNQQKELSDILSKGFALKPLRVFIKKHSLSVRTYVGEKKKRTLEDIVRDVCVLMNMSDFYPCIVKYKKYRIRDERLLEKTCKVYGCEMDKLIDVLETGIPRYEILDVLLMFCSLSDDEIEQFLYGNILDLGNPFLVYKNNRALHIDPLKKQELLLLPNVKTIGLCRGKHGLVISIQYNSNNDDIVKHLQDKYENYDKYVDFSQLGKYSNQLSVFRDVTDLTVLVTLF